jgi:predicted lipoprotein with Yx(FWY)xxD motif
MTRSRATGLLAALATAAAGCGEEPRTASEKQRNNPPRAPEAVVEKGPANVLDEKKPARAGARLKIVESRFGRVVADRHGEALYLFDKEQKGRAECYGTCARAWPPMLTKGKPVAGDGARQRLLGTTRRRDGKLQVTYRGQPLYYYVADSPGQILCQNVDEFGGLWLVVQPNGRPVQ